MTLAEIIEEGESLLDSARDATERNTRDRRIRQAQAESFAVEHFATLLAVAKAAVEFRKARRLWENDDPHPGECPTHGECPECAAICDADELIYRTEAELFYRIDKSDAAVRGEGKEKANE